jgi:hypothetical protein
MNTVRLGSLEASPTSGTGESSLGLDATMQELLGVASADGLPTARRELDKNLPTLAELETYVAARHAADLAATVSQQKWATAAVPEGGYGAVPPLPTRVVLRRAKGVPPPDTISARAFVYATGILGRQRPGALDFASLDHRPGSAASVLPALEPWLEGQADAAAAAATTARGRHNALPFSPLAATRFGEFAAAMAALTPKPRGAAGEDPPPAAVAPDAPIDLAGEGDWAVLVHDDGAVADPAAAATTTASAPARAVPQLQMPLLRADSRRLLTLEPSEFFKPTMPTAPMQAQLDAIAAAAAQAEAKAVSACAAAALASTHAAGLAPKKSKLLTLKLAAKGVLFAVHFDALAKQRAADLQRCVPKVVQPKAITDGAAKTVWEATEAEARQKPGVGDYDTTAAHRAQVERRLRGKFNGAVVPTALEVELARNAQVPGPGAYDAPPRVVRGGKFSTAVVPTDVEWKMAAAAKLPGPGAYDTSAAKPPPSGGKFSSAVVPSDVELKMAAAAKLPGPGAYPGVRADGGVGGGKFNAAVVPSELEWIEKRAGLTPGPCAYDTAPSAATKGGKMSATSPPTELEWIEKRGSSTPGPGAYDVRAASNHTLPSGHTGKFPFVWRPLDPKMAKFAKGVALVRTANAFQAGSASKAAARMLAATAKAKEGTDVRGGEGPV